MKRIILWLYSLLLLTTLYGKTIYVNTKATGNKDGSSWANAYVSLQPALNIAGNGDQIWVARGEYFPSSSYKLTDSPRYYHFEMKKGVGIYGGFVGSETDIKQRINYGLSEINETILSGDIGIANKNEDNCYHVIYNPAELNLDNSSILDGFTISNGNANINDSTLYSHRFGGGIYNISSSPVINNCKFNNNNAYYGGGFYNQDGSPIISNCSFTGNSTLYDGGGIFNYNNSVLSVNNCTFIKNKAESGGGIENFNNSLSEITNCFFFGNSAAYGGGINNVNSPVRIINCVFSGNTGEYGGGLGNSNSASTIINCTFSGNSTKNFGGGICNTESSPVITNSIFWGNYKEGDQSISEIYGGTSDNFTYCDIRNGNNTYKGRGNIFNNPLFVDADGKDNIYGTIDDSFALQDNSPCIGAGTIIGVPETDIIGNKRGNPPDIGAYENSLNMQQINIIYVNAVAHGNNNGTNWIDAFISLQDALAKASIYNQIWVAKGIYKPTNGIDRTVSFQMKNGVKIYGGFAGNETEINQRVNYGAGKGNETILSGNIGDINNNTDNSFHVFNHSSDLLLDSTAVLDGFTIMGGYADSDYPDNSGGGMFNDNCKPYISNCNFNGNYAKDAGGGIYNEKSSPTIYSCIFNYNSVSGSSKNNQGGGGGICNNDKSSPLITKCSFTNNSAYDTNGDDESGGGGIYNEYNSSPLIDYCNFTGNTAEFNGGGIHNVWYASPLVLGCIFSNNTAGKGGGGGICNEHDTWPIIKNCLIKNNNADYGGGMTAGYKASPIIVNCTISKNFAKLGSGFYLNSYATPVVTNSIFWGDYKTGTTEVSEISPSDKAVITYSCIQEGNAFYSGNGNIFSNPLFIDAVNGNYRLLAGSPCINAGLDPSAGNNVPITDIDGNKRPLGARTDIGAYECYNNASYPTATTFVLSNEGGLIDYLVQKGYGNKNLYETLELLQPKSGGVLTDEFMTTLKNCPAGSEIFTTRLNNFVSATNNPVGINIDGTCMVVDIFGKDYYEKTGYPAFASELFGSQKGLFISASSAQYYINSGISYGNGSNYYVFAIAWSAGSLSITPDTVNISAANNSLGTFEITTDTTWTVLPKHSWLTADPLSGKGNKIIKLIAEANPYTADRIDTVIVSAPIIGSKLVIIKQAGRPTGIEDNKTKPEKYALSQNYPNPFNPSTTICYQLPVVNKVQIKIYDMLGREVAVLVDEEKAPGSYEVKFNASNLSSGIYLYKIKAGDYFETKKLILLK